MVIAKICVTVPVKKYVAHFHSVDPFVLSSKNRFGLLLKTLIDNYDESAKKEKRLNQDKYKEVLPVLITEDIYRRNGYFFAPSAQLDFNELVEKMIDYDFYTHMHYTYQLTNAKKYKCIYSFRDKFDFTEDDLTLKCLEKKYQRYQNKLNA